MPERQTSKGGLSHLELGGNAQERTPKAQPYLHTLLNGEEQMGKEKDATKANPQSDWKAKDLDSS